MAEMKFTCISGSNGAVGSSNAVPSTGQRTDESSMLIRSNVNHRDARALDVSTCGKRAVGSEIKVTSGDKRAAQRAFKGRNGGEGGGGRSLVGGRFEDSV